MSHTQSSNLSTLAVCAAILATLMIWVVIWPQTGDGDAITHFLCARDAFGNPTWLMSAWARVGAKLPLLIPAHFGMLPTRWVCAVIATLCAWQTIRLADDLKLHHAVLAAPMMIFQPLVFEHAADTMTEIPFALGLVIAIRLFWAKRWLASALVVSYLPMVRPEGFFICAMWGILFVGTSQLKLPRAGSGISPSPGTPGEGRGEGQQQSTSSGLAGPHPNALPEYRERGQYNLRRRIILCAALSTGTICWAIACWIITGKPNYFLSEGWTWNATEAPFGHGSLFSYLIQWPAYCGHVLFVLFLLGLVPLVRQWKRYALPASVFCLIFLLHSILWWRGWFASQGLLRIMGSIAPITAIVCLLGFNVLAGWLARLRVPLPIRKTLAGAVMAAIVLTAFQYYLQLPMHYRIFGVQAAVRFARASHTFENVPALILRDPMAQPEIPLPPNPQMKIISRDDLKRERMELLDAPIGSAGIWDDQHSGEPGNVDIAQLPALGYTILYRFAQTVPGPLATRIGAGKATEQQTYVVIRKDR